MADDRLALATGSPAGDDRRAEILDAALEAFTERGYAATTIADVRSRSRASVGSLYHRFGDKQGLAAAVYVECLRDYQAGLVSVLATSRGPERGVRAIVAHHLDWVEGNRARASFLFERREPEIADASGAEVRNLNAAVFAAVREWLHPHVEAGAIRPMSLELFYVIVLGPSQEYARHWLRRPDPERIGGARRILARAAWNAVRADRS